ncbi:MAG: glycosyltransferase family 4 protein, partial [Planctomycetes bacterium]|nr:glycosyltransferase family 4 protein [Planctomycetota bacterium]
MRILLVSPGPLHIPGGNSRSIQRLFDGLRALGHEVFTVDSSAPDGGDPPRGPFDVVHGFHILKGGRLAARLAREWNARLVVTLTGTETSVDWQIPDRREAMLEVLRAGAGVVALRASHLEELRELCGLPLGDAAVIPQTIHIGQEPFDVRAELGLGPEIPLVFLPGGLRPVKGQDWALDVVEGDGEDWHLILAGPVLDREFATEILVRVAACSRAHYLGAVEPARMGALFEASDLVLNTSEAEGESNAI